MKPPGAWLKRWAEQACDRTTLNSVLLPTLADLEHEYATAPSSRRIVVQLRGYRAFWTALILCVMRDGEGAMRSVLWGLGRSLILTLVVLLLALTAMTSQGVIALSSWVDGLTVLKAVASLVPTTLLIALPAALFLAIVFEGRSGWRESRARVFGAVLIASTLCSLLSLTLAATAVPTGNRSYRSILSASYGLDSPFRELRRLRFDEVRIAGSVSPEITLDGHLSGRAQVHYYLNSRIFEEPSVQRWAVAIRLGLALAPLAFGLIAFALAGPRRATPGV